jgi:polyhydroxyalkanoate synthesis regulator phasin
LIARYDVLNSRIDDLRQLEKDFATEDKNRNIVDIKTKENANALLTKQIGLYRQLYNTDQLTGDKQKEILTTINALQAKKDALLEEERQKREALDAALRKEEAQPDLRARNAGKRLVDMIRGQGGGGQAGPQGQGGMGGGGGQGQQQPQGQDGPNLGDVVAQRVIGGVDQKKIQRNARNAAMNLYRQKIEELNQAFDDEVDEIRQKVASGEIGGREGDKLRAAALKDRNKGRLAARAIACSSTFSFARAANKVVDALVDQGSLNEKQAEAAKQLTQAALNTQAQVDELKANYDTLIQLLQVKNKAARNQRAGQR